jgi:ClpP class serine protease
VTEDGRAKVQATVDSLAQVFIDRVATFRGVTSRHVIENFGRGGLVVGAAAVAAGMADALGSLESVIASSASMSPSA